MLCHLAADKQRCEIEICQLGVSNIKRLLLLMKTAETYLLANSMYQIHLIHSPPDFAFVHETTYGLVYHGPVHNVDAYVIN